MIERLQIQISAGMAGEFSSPESTLCADSYLMSVSPPMLQQWHIKDPSHCAKSAGGRLHLDMYTPLTQCWITLTMPMSRHSVGTYHSGKKAPIQLTGNTRPQSSSLA